MTRQDKYKNFEALSQNEKENKDFDIVVRTAKDSKVAIVAPHGGRIEFLTAELADCIAGDDHHYYAMRGLKPKNNWDLHITSHCFDEKRALALIESCEKVVTIHGLSGEDVSLQIGGRDEALRSRIHEELQRAGFNSKIITKGAYGGMDSQNICNRGSLGAGVQLEIHKGLRTEMKNNKNLCKKFVVAVRSAL